MMTVINVSISVFHQKIFVTSKFDRVTLKKEIAKRRNSELLITEKRLSKRKMRRIKTRRRTIDVYFVLLFFSVTEGHFVLG